MCRFQGLDIVALWHCGIVVLWHCGKCCISIVKEHRFFSKPVKRFTRLLVLLQHILLDEQCLSGIPFE